MVKAFESYDIKLGVFLGLFYIHQSIYNNLKQIDNSTIDMVWFSLQQPTCTGIYIQCLQHGANTGFKKKG